MPPLSLSVCPQLPASFCLTVAFCSPLTCSTPSLSSPWRLLDSLVVPHHPHTQTVLGSLSVWVVWDSLSLGGLWLRAGGRTAVKPTCSLWDTSQPLAYLAAHLLARLPHTLITASGISVLSTSWWAPIPPRPLPPTQGAPQSHTSLGTAQGPALLACGGEEGWLCRLPRDVGRPGRVQSFKRETTTWVQASALPPGSMALADHSPSRNPKSRSVKWVEWLH